MPGSQQSWDGTDVLCALSAEPIEWGTSGDSVRTEVWSEDPIADMQLRERLTFEQAVE